MNIRIPKTKTEIGKNGDYYLEMDKAIIRVDGNEMGFINVDSGINLSGKFI